MLGAFVRFALRRRLVVLTLAAALIAYGVYTLKTARYDVFPNFAPPMVKIQTASPGLAPRAVERLVTTPLEAAVVGLPGLRRLQSKSIQGLSLLKVTFRSNSAIYLDRQLVAERLATVALPAGVHLPQMTPLTSASGTVMNLALTSRRLNLMRLRTISDWDVRLPLLAAPGVASVITFGGNIQEYQVQFLPRRLVAYHLPLAAVVAAARRATAVLGAGFVSTPNQRLVLEAAGQLTTPQRIAGVVVARANGQNVTLGDLARVRLGRRPPIGAGAYNGQPAVVLSVKAQYGANTLVVARNVRAVLRRLGPRLQREGVRLHITFRPANYIHSALGGLAGALELGAILVVIILALFLFDLRAAAISVTAIPLSLLTAVVVLAAAGQSLNTMTLGGLAIAIGEVVDDAVIDVENIARRLRENRRSPSPRAALRVVYDASLEVRSAVVYATFAVVLIFLPVLRLSGVAGRLFAPLGWAYILSILASLLVALTVTPALAYWLLAERAEGGRREPPVMAALRRGYGAVLAFVDRAWLGAVAVAAALVVAGVAVLLTFSSSFLPRFREDHQILHMTLAPGASLGESLRLGGEATARLRRATPNILSVAQRAGRATFGEARGPEGNELGLQLRPHMNGAQYDATLAAIHRAIRPIAGATFALNSFFAERFNETLSGFRQPVVVEFFGRELRAVNAAAARSAAVLRGLPGARGVTIQAPATEPTVSIRLRPRAVARWGLDPVSVLDAAQTAFRGTVTGQVYRGDRVFNVRVILPPDERHGLAALRRLPIETPDGGYVALRQVARIRERAGLETVLHLGARRAQAVTVNVAGVPLSRFVQRARAALARRAPLPPGVSRRIAGAAAAQQRARRELLVYGALALLGIVLLLSVVMLNGRNLLLVLANLPFALIGGVFAVWWLLGGRMSLGAMVAFITLFGITIRNSIMLISHYEHLVAREGMAWGPEAAHRGAAERLAPILMTALVTGLGLLPLALRSGAPGLEIEGPMAIVILGGLVTSTALNLLLLPALARRYGRFAAPAPDVL